MEKETLRALVQLSPAHFRDLKAAAELVETELEYSKTYIDGQINKAINRNEYDLVQDLVNISKSLHNQQMRIQELFEEIEEPADFQDEDLLVEQCNRTYINYDDYKVDDTIEHNLFSQVTFRKPIAFKFKGKVCEASSWSSILVRTCEKLYEIDSELFATFLTDLDFKGKRKYRFSVDKNTLRKPVKIADSDIYAETNLSANDIRKELLLLLKKYNLESDTITVFIGKDFSSLHN